MEVPVGSVKFGKTGCGRWDRLKNVWYRRKGVHWTNDILIQLGIVFAVAFWHEKSRRAPFCGLIIRHNDARGNMLGNLRISRLLKT